MVLSKDLKRIMVSGAALLMLASAGVASANNMNVNAKRRHVHVSRRVHLRKHAKKHARKRHVKPFKLDNTAALLEKLNTPVMSSENDDIQPSGYDATTGSQLYFNDQSTANPTDGMNFDQEISDDSSLSPAQQAQVVQLTTPPKANAPVFRTPATRTNVHAAQRLLKRHHKTARHAPLTLTAAPSQVFAHAARHAKRASQRKTLMRKAHRASRVEKVNRKRVAHMSPWKIIRQLKAKGALKGVNHRVLVALTHKPALLHRLMNDYGKVQVGVRPHTARAKRALNTARHAKRRAVKKHMSRAQRNRAMKQLKQNILKLMQEEGLNPSKGTQITLQF